MVLLVLAAAGCETVQTVHAGQLLLTPGEEESPWKVSPKATSARLYTIAASGVREDGRRVDAPIKALNVNRGEASAYGFDGVNDDGQRVLGGRSLLVDAEALAESSLPLFYSRTQAFARPPGEFAVPPGSAPVHAVLQGRYWVSILPNDDETMTLVGYDLLTWSVDLDELRIGCPSSPCMPTAAACSDWTLLVLGESWGIWVDLETGSSGDVPLPRGLESFAALSGARTINGPGDRAFLVGPSRTAEATDAVLVLKPDRSLTLLRTQTARRAAATIWADGVGLAVVGGSDAAPAVELLGELDDEFVELAFPAFPAFSAQVAVDASSLVSLGGLDAEGAPARAASFDLRCSDDCEPDLLPFDLDVSGGVAAMSESGTYTVIGADSAGETLGAVVHTADASVLAIRAPRSRQGASYAVLPTGHLGVIGGGTSTAADGRRIELILP